MGKAATDVQVPGAPAAPDAADPAAPAATDNAAPAAVDNDAVIAQLRAELAAERAKNMPAGEAVILEGDGPNTRKYKAESKHLSYTAAELDKAVRSGKVKLTEHHVLCKDGWYVNPSSEKQANG